MSKGHDAGRPEESRELPWDRPVTRRDLLRYGATLGFGAVGASMLASCTPVPELQSVGSADANPPPSAKYVVIFIVDGCRADYLSFARLPNLSSMMRQGTYYKNAWVGLMESITPACHAAIGSGLLPKNNGGILGFYWENPTTLQYLECADLTNDLALNQPGSQSAINADSLAAILKAAGTPTMASLLKDADPTAKIYAGAGVKFYAVDAAGGPDADYISYFWNDGPDTYRPLSIPGHDLPADLIDDPAFRTHDYQTANYAHPGEQDSLVVDLAIKVVQRERPRIVILNLGEMDFPFGHENGGPLSPRYVKDVMTNADQALGRLFNAYRDLGIFDQTAFAFLGDHGMVPLDQQVDSSPVYTAAINAGTSVVGGDFHTGGFVWLMDPSRALKTTTFIDDAKMPAVSAVYFRGETGGLPRYLPSPATASSLDPFTDSAYRYMLETLNGPNGPHVVLLYPERTGSKGAGGTGLHGAPNVWHGDHGGISWGSHSIPLILTGPGIRSEYVSRFPARLVDLAPTLLSLLGVPYPQMDGVVLADSLRKPVRGDLVAQQVMARQLTPVAAALKRQSAIDVQYLQTHTPVDPPSGSGGQIFTGIGTY